MAAGKQTAGKGGGVVIKKIIKKKSYEAHGHHGGAWKVAYADFVTAMMALFLVLWLVAVLSVDSQTAIAKYFRSYTVFAGNEAGGGKGISVLSGDVVRLDDKNTGDTKPDGGADAITVVTRIGKRIEKRLADMVEQVVVRQTPDGGIRIEFVESAGRPLFDPGGAHLTERGARALAVVSEVLLDIPAKISIEGHTDGQPLPDPNYSNWELAADRANSARRALVQNGISPKSIYRVISYADAKPLDKNNPDSPSNRRVSIFVDMNAEKERHDRNTIIQPLQ